MSEATGWDELKRLEQRALIKLFGGGAVCEMTILQLPKSYAREASSMSTTRSRCLDCSF
jgi:hypothetical protein